MIINFNLSKFFLCFLVCSSALTCIVAFAVENDVQQNKTSFAVDYENDQFLLDGKPFRYISGSFHYFRTPRADWRDRLRKMRAAGLNAVSTYVEWSLHQPQPDRWDWYGDSNLVEFIKLAQEEDLLVLLRPGPYICAERDFGGFPYWLLKLVPDIKLRTNDERYMKFVEEYLDQVFLRIKPFLRGNGGPIIMVQVENEYGSFYACDHDYMNKVRDIMKKHVEDKAVLYTTDPPDEQVLKCGRVSGAYTTVDFGTDSNVTKYFSRMRQFEPRGPLVNSEFYTGWLPHWGEPFPRVASKKITAKLDEILSTGASVNIYMFVGGTNFNLSAGANLFDKYAPDLTTYDYDAPISEAGDPTPKYFDMRNTISKYVKLPDIPVPPASEKKKYHKQITVQMGNIFRYMTNPWREFKIPPSFESLGINPGLWAVMYEAEVPVKQENVTLHAVPRDRVLVYLDHKLAGNLSRAENTTSLTLNTTGSHKILLLVENQGHINFGNESVEDFKGVFNVSMNGIVLSPWNVSTVNDTVDSVGNAIMEQFTVPNRPDRSKYEETGKLSSGPQLGLAAFFIDGEPCDTFLNTTGWGLGIVSINNRLLGRYWPSMGPQMTLYVPASFLKKDNSLMLIELEHVPEHRTINFQTEPVLDYP